MPPDFLTEVIKVIGTLSGVGITTWLAIKLKRLDKELKDTETANVKEKDELNHHTVAINYIIEFNVFNSLIEVINDIFTVTKIDRFLIFYAVNGKESFNTITAIFQMSQIPEKVNGLKRYNKLVIDANYKEMLGIVEQKGVFLINAEDMEDSLLKDFYAVEQVKHSIVKFIARKVLTPEKDMLLYCSFATHEGQAPTKTEIAYITANFGKIKDLVTKLST